MPRRSGLQIAAHGDHLTRDGGALIPTFRPGEVIGAMVRIARDGRPIDATDLFDLTYGELEGRRRAEEAFTFVREHVDGFADAFLAGTAVQQGVRESRRIVGAATLRAGDLAACRHGPRDIAIAAWPQEFHVSGRGTEYRFFADGASYGIPFDVLVPSPRGCRVDAAQPARRRSLHLGRAQGTRFVPRDGAVHGPRRGRGPGRGMGVPGR